MDNISKINLARAVQVLRKYNTFAAVVDGFWDIRGGLVDECVYARFTADNKNKFCLSTAALSWDQDDLEEMISAVNRIKDCLEELREIDPELVR